MAYARDSSVMMPSVDGFNVSDFGLTPQDAFAPEEWLQWLDTKGMAAPAPTTNKRKFDEVSKDADIPNKKLLNKVAADKYRRKKKEQFEQLSKDAETLHQEKHRLEVRCTDLEKEVAYLRSLLVLAVRKLTGEDPAKLTAQERIKMETSTAGVAAPIVESLPSSPFSSSSTDTESRLSQMEAQIYALSAALSLDAKPFSS